ncbi:MAG: ClbS/DfsB family four-helix bundle protein [Paracoccaceae bacterium]
MAAKTKTELLEITEKEFAKLERAIQPIGDDVAELKDDEDTSIKDVVAHRAHWIGLFLGWYVDGLAGKPVHFPAEGYKWNDLKRYNSELRQQHASMSWGEAIDALHANHKKLSDLLNDCSNDDLYGGPMKGAYNDWTPGRWAEAAGPSHYRSASKYIRSRLKSLN